MIALKTNYKNDVYFGSRKYKQINNSDGTISLEDVTTYQTLGDSFGAGDINKITSTVMGFFDATTNFEDDGSIVETDGYGSKKITVFNDDGSISENYYVDDVLVKTKTTVFNDDGSISVTCTNIE